MNKIAEILTGGTTEIKGVEIFNTFPNTHGIKFSDKDIEQLLKNFSQFPEIKPNIKISHSEQQAILKSLIGENVDFAEELPALGFISNLRKNGQSIIADIVDIPEKLKFIYKKYKTFSPEILWNYRGQHGKVFSAVSLTNIESMKHIPSIYLSELKDFDVNSEDALRFSGEINIIKRSNNMSDELKDDIKKMSDEITGFKGVLAKFSEMFKKKESVNIDTGLMTIEQVQNMIDAESQKNFSEIAGLKEQLKKSEEDSKKFSENMALIAGQAKRESADAICAKAITDGVPPVVVEIFKPVLFSDFNTGKIKFSEMVDGKEVEKENTLTEVVKNFFEIYPDKVDFSDVTSTSTIKPGDVSKEKKAFSEIEAIAKKNRDSGMSEYEALDKATDEFYERGNE